MTSLEQFVYSIKVEAGEKKIDSASFGSVMATTLLAGVSIIPTRPNAERLRPSLSTALLRIPLSVPYVVGVIYNIYHIYLYNNIFSNPTSQQQQLSILQDKRENFSIHPTHIIAIHTTISLPFDHHVCSIISIFFAAEDTSISRFVLHSTLSTTYTTLQYSTHHQPTRCRDLQTRQSPDHQRPNQHLREHSQLGATEVFPPHYRVILR